MWIMSLVLRLCARACLAGSVIRGRLVALRPRRRALLDVLAPSSLSLSHSHDDVARDLQCIISFKAFVLAFLANNIMISISRRTTHGLRLKLFVHFLSIPATRKVSSISRRTRLPRDAISSYFHFPSFCSLYRAKIRNHSHWYAHDHLVWVLQHRDIAL